MNKIPPEVKAKWTQLIQSGAVHLIDPPKLPEVEDPYDTDDYAAFVETMAKHCHCEPPSARPCDGVLAGGLCDEMDWSGSRLEEDEE